MATLPEGAADAFNRWMDDYINHPESFRRDWQAVTDFINTDEGAEPDYGRSCVALFERYMNVSETPRYPVPSAPPPDGGG